MAHSQAIAKVRNEVSNSGTFSMVPRSFNLKANAGVMVEWIVRLPCNPATGARSAEGCATLRFLPSFVIYGKGHSII